MAGQGAEVIVLEPFAAMLDQGKELTGNKVIWLNDELISLNYPFNGAINGVLGEREYNAFGC
ncbi:hypothetical protein A6E14_05200 [Vibrio genomosp. F10]|uniref:Uncharacterized protein n=2 Tax=Vibrio genomosp. F10 TaxID=723171 RepID=A0A1B9R2A6_9VIBR|nr:hypothetical protein A6E14_05200 [Vibrio genomosp. F10]OEE33874.1 hypothetical protein A1QO_09035 [Vibrio genomosp. F10 str. ZF-129]OEE97559.1 hypothetical protein A1QM_14600 [Vibrio genomosp. F10 str. 9ZC157]OEF08262.1 hypothetical protein A1QI_04335 [Vibrio genomosp. F10 str. 9ZB36]